MTDAEMTPFNVLLAGFTRTCTINLGRDSDYGRVAALHAAQRNRYRQIPGRQTIRQSHYDKRAIETGDSHQRADVFDRQRNASHLNGKNRRVRLSQAKVGSKQQNPGVAIGAEVMIVENTKRSSYERNRVQRGSRIRSAGFD